MASKDAYPSKMDEYPGQSPSTTTFFNALSGISAQPGGIRNLAWHVEHLAGRPGTADVFGPIEQFGRLHHRYDFDTAVRSIDVHNPKGVDVSVVLHYDEGGDHEAAEGKIVALLDADMGEHGVYTGLAVTDRGNGPAIVDVAFRANVPGIAYLNE